MQLSVLGKYCIQQRLLLVRRRAAANLEGLTNLPLGQATKRPRNARELGGHSEMNPTFACQAEGSWREGAYEALEEQAPSIKLKI